MKTTRTITVKQRAILTFLYRFRFASTRHIQHYLGLVTERAALKKLTILLDRGYIGRNYSARDSLLGRPASYYLTAAGIRAIKGYKRNEQGRVVPRLATDDPGIDQSVVHRIYRDPRASTRFINLCLNRATVYTCLKRDYTTHLDFRTSSDLVGWDFHPRRQQALIFG